MYKPTFKRADVRITHQETVYHGFYQVQKLNLQHRLFNGGWSKELHRELSRISATYTATTSTTITGGDFLLFSHKHQGCRHQHHLC